MPYSSQLLRRVRSHIGNNIHSLRQKRHITLHKLSRLSGISEHRLDCYEIGKNEVRLEELVKIACVLQVHLETLVAKADDS